MIGSSPRCGPAQQLRVGDGKFMTGQAQRFCGELAERGLFLERLLVIEENDGRDPQPLITAKGAPPDALKCAAALEASARGAAVSYTCNGYRHRERVGPVRAP